MKDLPPIKIPTKFKAAISDLTLSNLNQKMYAIFNHKLTHFDPEQLHSVIELIH
jgi:hypothetical protein